MNEERLDDQIWQLKTTAFYFSHVGLHVISGQGLAIAFSVSFALSVSLFYFGLVLLACSPSPTLSPSLFRQLQGSFSIMSAVWLSPMVNFTALDRELSTQEELNVY